MRKAINVALFVAVAVSSSPIAAFANEGEDDAHHPVTNQQYPAGTSPVIPGPAVQQPGYLGQPGLGHTNDPLLNPGHNNSWRHQVKDSLNSRGQGLAPGYAGYGAPGVAPVYGGYPASSYQAGQGYPGQPGAGHINDPSINPGHNNSPGHQLKDVINPNSTPAYGSTVPGFGYPGVAPVGVNHVNNPYINPGHNGSVQHQMNDAAASQIYPGQAAPITNQRRRGNNHGHNDSNLHSH